MKKKHYLTILTMVVIGIISLSMKSGVPVGIKNAFQEGSATILCKFVDKKLDLVIMDEENEYTRQQAEKKLAAFFLAHKPIRFTIHHEGGGRGNLKYYAIGKLNTSNGNFKITMLLQNNFLVILRIEKDGY